jgi:hypothetical protein
MHTDKRAKKKSYRCQVQYYNMKTFFIAMIPQRKKNKYTNNKKRMPGFIPKKNNHLKFNINTRIGLANGYSRDWAPQSKSTSQMVKMEVIHQSFDSN